MAFNPEQWRASKAQKEEILQGLAVLGFTLEDYGGGLTWENMLWFQAVSIIGGLNFLIDNPKSWTRLPYQSSIL